MVTRHVRLSCSWMAVIVIVYEWSCNQQITGHPNTPNSKKTRKPKIQRHKNFKSKCCSITSPPVNQRETTNAMIGFDFFAHSYHQKLFPVFWPVWLLVPVDWSSFHWQKSTPAKFSNQVPRLPPFDISMNLSILQWLLPVAWSSSHFSWSPFRKSPKSMKFLMLLIEVIHLVTTNKNPKALDFTRKPKLRDKQTSIMKSKFVEAAVLLSTWKHDFKRRFSNKKSGKK